MSTYGLMSQTVFPCCYTLGWNCWPPPHWHVTIYWIGAGWDCPSVVPLAKGPWTLTCKSYCLCQLGNLIFDLSLQSLYDGLRRRCITPATFEGDGDRGAHLTPRNIQMQHDFRPLTTHDGTIITTYFRRFSFHWLVEHLGTSLCFDKGTFRIYDLGVEVFTWMSSQKLASPLKKHAGV